MMNVRYSLEDAVWIHYTSFPVASPQQVGSFPVYGKMRGNVSDGFWAIALLDETKNIIVTRQSQHLINSTCRASAH